MYLRCPECRTRYEISSTRIPEGGARVRCPRCRAVFHVARPTNGDGVPHAAHAVIAGAPVEPDVARRIARTMVYELLLSRRDQRDQALRTGRLLSALGSDILETWEDYRRRVGEALAQDTRFFQDAVNEILADGEALL